MTKKLRVTEAAARAGVADSTWRAYVAREQAPAADGQYDGRTPYWFESTVDAWIAARPGQGTRTDLKGEGATK